MNNYVLEDLQTPKSDEEIECRGAKHKNEEENVVFVFGHKNIMPHKLLNMLVHMSKFTHLNKSFPTLQCPDIPIMPTFRFQNKNNN